MDTKRTDQEWADYLECDVDEIASIRKTVNNMCHIGIITDPNGVYEDKYCFALFQKSNAPSGFERVHLVASGNEFFDTPEEAQEHAERLIIPNLELPEIRARILCIPPKAIQMLGFT